MTKQIFLLILIISITSTCFSQTFKADKNIIIGGSTKSFFYSNKFNLIVVTSIKDSIQNLIIKSSQGKLINIDSGTQNGIFHLINLKNGNVTISVYSKTDTGLHLLNYKRFSVITKQLTPEEIKLQNLKIKPEIQINGCKHGKVSPSCIRNSTKFDVNKPYKIKELTLFIGSTKGVNCMPLSFTLKSERFDVDLMRVIETINVGAFITLDKIEITDEKGAIYRLSPITFIVDND